MRYGKGIAIGVGLVALNAAIAGCGFGHAAGTPRRHHRTGKSNDKMSKSLGRADTASPTYTPRSTSIPVKVPVFPKIITMAMANLSGLAAVSAEAPTIVPWPDNGSTTLFYAPDVQGPSSGIPGLIDSYQVTLTSPPVLVAEFGNAIFASIADATDNVDAVLARANLRYPAPGAVAAVGSGVSAGVGKENGENVLAWTESGWSVVVVDPQRLPLRPAAVVAGYLDTHLMPQPEPVESGSGLILVEQRGAGLTTQVIWQEGRWVYQSKTFPTTAQPVTTALGLALSMRRYPR